MIFIAKQTTMKIVTYYYLERYKHTDVWNMRKTHSNNWTTANINEVLTLIGYNCSNKQSHPTLLETSHLKVTMETPPKKPHL